MPEQIPPSEEVKVPEQTPPENSISEEDREKIYEQVGKICDEYNISSACLLAVDPNSREPIMFFKGNKITVARLTALFTRLVKQEINQELAT